MPQWNNTHYYQIGGINVNTRNYNNGSNGNPPSQLRQSQYTVGTFTADATGSQTIPWNAVSGGGFSCVPAAVSLIQFAPTAVDADPGWNVADATVFIPVITVDSRGNRTEYEATSIRRSDGKPLGCFRWLIWAASPTMGEIGGQNTTFEELQVIPAGGNR